MAQEGAGAFGPGRLNVPFVRLPVPVIARMRRKGMPTKWAVLAVLFKWCRDGGDGWAYASCARSEVSDLLGITVGQVRNATESLKRDGLLQVSRPGHRGRATVYRIRIGSESERDPFCIGSAPETDPIEKGPAHGSDPNNPEDTPHTEYAEKGHPTNTPYSAVGSAPETDPIRNLKKVSYGDRPDDGGQAHLGPASSEEKPKPVLHSTPLGADGRLGDLFAGDRDR